MQKLKPAHEVAIEKIQYCCPILKDMEGAVKRTETREAKRAKSAKAAAKKIRRYHAILKDIGKAIEQAEAREATLANSAAAWTPATELNRGRLQFLGSFHGHLESLQEMLIPEDKLEWVIKQLKELHSRDPQVSVTVEELRQRVRTTVR